MDETNIGFIGLGNMGAGMALNLLRHCQESGDALIVFDIIETVLADVTAKGAVNGQSVARLCSQCEVLFTSLPSSKEINFLGLIS